MWHNCPYLFFTWWYLKLIFVLDTFWTEISTSSQNERRWVDPRTGRLPNWKKMLGPFMELLWVNQSNYRITRQHFVFSQWNGAESSIKGVRETFELRISAFIEIMNNKARHNLMDAKCRWHSDWLQGLS